LKGKEQMLEPEKKVIRFITHCHVGGDAFYMQDEVAGFLPRIADRICKDGFAVVEGDGKPKPVGRRIAEAENSGFSNKASVSEKIRAFRNGA
jgi:hypothetical protein